MVKLDRVPDDARRVLIAVNPRAGAQNRQTIVDTLCQELWKQGCEPSVHADIDELAHNAESLMDSGKLRAVVSAGGDGTFRLIAERTPPRTPLVVLPLGTENLLARYMGF